MSAKLEEAGAILKANNEAAQNEELPAAAQVDNATESPTETVAQISHKAALTQREASTSPTNKTDDATK